MEVLQHPSESLETGSGPMKRGAGPWVRPSVSRLAAGSAEDGNNIKPDNAQPS
jgi:hypothetical protein